MGGWVGGWMCGCEWRGFLLALWCQYGLFTKELCCSPLVEFGMGVVLCARHCSRPGFAKSFSYRFFFVLFFFVLSNEWISHSSSFLFYSYMTLKHTQSNIKPCCTMRSTFPMPCMFIVCGMLVLKYLGGLDFFQQEFSHAQWLADHDRTELLFVMSHRVCASPLQVPRP